MFIEGGKGVWKMRVLAAHAECNRGAVGGGLVSQTLSNDNIYSIVLLSLLYRSTYIHIAHMQLYIYTYLWRGHRPK